MGWYYYNEPPVPATLEEQIGAISTAKKLALINAYTAGQDYSSIKHEIGLTRAIVQWWNGPDGLFNQIRDKSIAYLKGEVGSVPPPIGNNGADLYAFLLIDFGGAATWANLPNGEIQYIVERMIAYSNSDGTGDWAFFVDGVVNGDPTGSAK